MNCRSVPATAWEHARQALVFYFSRRYGLSNAEDLAQETLTALWIREDFEFEKEVDFLKICYGFASNILLAAKRKGVKNSLNTEETVIAAPGQASKGLKDVEVRVYLNEVLRLGKEQLRDPDWQLLKQAIVVDGERSSSSVSANEANKKRVQLHRVRKKLASLAGWSRDGCNE